MLAVARKVLSFEMTVAEWIGAGIMAAVPVIAVIAVLWWLLLPGVCAA